MACKVVEKEDMAKQSIDKNQLVYSNLYESVLQLGLGYYLYSSLTLQIEKQN